MRGRKLPKSVIKKLENIEPWKWEKYVPTDEPLQTYVSYSFDDGDLSFFLLKEVKKECCHSPSCHASPFVISEDYLIQISQKRQGDKFGCHLEEFRGKRVKSLIENIDEKISEYGNLSENEKGSMLMNKIKAYGDD